MRSTRRGRIGMVARASLALGVSGALAGSFLVAFAGTAYATGTTWFVATTGTDTTTCTTAAAPCKTITQALTNAKEGDTISVGTGTFTKPLLITKGVTIQGAGQSSTFIDGGETTPTASSVSAMDVDLPNGDANVLTVSGVTIQHGISTFGGGIELLAGNMIVNNSTITNNEAGGIAKSIGGAGIGELGTILGTTQQLTLNNDTISNNKTVVFTGLTIDGGGLYLAGPASIAGSTITGNSTAGSAYGGGIFMAKLVATDSAVVSLTDSTVNGNSSVVGGGICNYSGGQLTLIGDSNGTSSVSSNTGTDGAGIYDVGSATITNTAISSDVASFEGGGFFETQAVAADAPVITATGVTLASNKALIAGGGVVNAASVFTMNGGSIAGSAAVDGAGLYVAGGGTASLIGATVSNNIANGGSTANGGLGGGIFNAGALSVTGHSILTANQAIASSAASTLTGWGGGVFDGPAAAGNAPTFTLTNSTVSGGSLVSGTNAAVGGGLAVTGNVLGSVAPGFSATAATFTGSGDTISGNTAIDGGGAYVGGTASFAGSTFSGNAASGSTLSLGGGLFVGKDVASDPASAVVDSTSFSQNSGVLGGGAAVNSSSTLTIKNASVFNQNSATNSGGGLYLGGNATIADSTLENGTAAEFGGAIFDGSVVAADTPVLTGTNVTMTGNSTPFEGGAVTVAAKATLNLSGGSLDNNTSVAGGGLLIAAGGKSQITGTDISGNTANGSDGGAVDNGGALTIVGSEIVGNKAIPASGSPTTTGFGGAIYSGSGAASTAVTLTLASDTISDNTANAAGALLTISTGSGDTNTTSITNSTVTGNIAGPSFGAIDAFDPVTITSSTINGNTAPAGHSAGLFVEVAGAISVAGSDVTGNNAGANCSSPVVDGGYNLTDSADASCGFTSAKHDISANPQLGALASNGGPTMTELPAPTSPLINQIPVNSSTGLNDAVSGSPVVLCATGATDQRGTARPEGATCDIGSVEVGVSPPTVSGPLAATFLVGVAGIPQIFTTTGTSTAQLSESGSLPSGVTFQDNNDGTATLAGKPANGTTGTFPITITAANGTAPNATLSFVLTVDQAAALSGPSGDTFTVNTAGSDSFVATGTPIPAVSESGTLPNGVTFSDNGHGTGTLAGTPAVGTQGTYAVVITAHNGEGADATLNFTLTVLPPVTITTTSLPSGTVGTAYATTHLAAGNGVAPYTWSLASGSLPAGLTLANNGTISGTPNGPAGTSSFVIRVTDSATPSGTATQALSITVAKGTTSLAVSPLLLGPPLVLTIGSASAILTGGSPLAGIAGQTVTFKAGSTTLCTGVTGANGAVTCNFTVNGLLVAVLSNGVTATYAGSSSWLPSSGSAGLL